LRRLTPGNIAPRILLLLGGVCLVQIQIANLAAIPFATGSGMAVCLYGLAVGVTGAVLSVMLVPIQLTVPNRMRGQTMSIAYCGVNLLGTGLGPFLAGFLNERLLAAAPRLGCAWPLCQRRLRDHCKLSVARSYFAFTRQSTVAKPTEIIASGVRQG
jgi:MFS family permease